MAVTIRSARQRPPGDGDWGLVDMRDGSPVLAGSYAEDDGDVVSAWHEHDLHQLIYALEGTVQVESSLARHLLPPQQAAWIPAGLTHRTTLRRVRSASVFFAPEMFSVDVDRVHVLPALPVIREMILYAGRWPITRTSSDAVADAFFRALGQLCLDWLEAGVPLCLPVSRDPLVGHVLQVTEERLAHVTLDEVCLVVGMSERSLRRRFLAETGMTWQRYRLLSRLLRAMTLLADGGTTVLAAARAVGFSSVSAFTRAFVDLTGETPSAYRRRVLAGAGTNVTAQSATRR